MNRFKYGEMSFSRILNGVSRRLQNIPHSIAWHLPGVTARRNVDRLSGYTNIHRGERCFILANGPSLAKMDLSILAHEYTFGLNRIYLLFERLAFRPTYYVCVNELVLEQFSDEISQLAMPKFLNWNRRDLYSLEDTSINYLRFSLGFRDVFRTTMGGVLSSGGTVTFVALQLAYIMGFSEVVLVGLDHSFTDKGVPNKIETRSSDNDVNHFHPNYFPKGSKWQLPDLKRSELGYALAREAFEMDARKILDATVNGKCDVFEKVDFGSLF